MNSGFTNWISRASGKYFSITFTLILLLLSGCSQSAQLTAPSSNPDYVTQENSTVSPGYIPWGFYQLEIARDGSYAEVIPMRQANDVMWGYHMNVVKMLEVAPCTNCLSLSNIHPMPNGDVSVDITLRHPYTDQRYTGFDVRGIIMFPATQYYPDDNIRELLGLEPYGDFWKLRIAKHEYGDAELMNADGWTVAWASEEGTSSWDYWWYQKFAPDKELPIFQYFPGIFTSGENLSTLSAFKRYHSTETRHMFEVGHVVTQNYVIRPPATGSIMAGYAVYAHWYPADKVPVEDPAVDFPPEANSPLPYEFYITQDAPLDPDAPHDVIWEMVHWHIKTWSIGPDYWNGSVTDIGFCGSNGYPPIPHTSGEPDDYMVVADYLKCYPAIPGAMPGTWTILCNFGVANPKDMWPNSYIGQDTYIMDFEYGALDGQW